MGDIKVLTPYEEKILAEVACAILKEFEGQDKPDVVSPAEIAEFVKNWRP